MARYTSRNHQAISAMANEEARLNNQVILTGLNETFPVPRGVFFLEYLEAAAGTTVDIADGEGRAIATGVADFSNDKAPIRCDYGITITGTLVLAKGYVIRDVFAS